MNRIYKMLIRTKRTRWLSLCLACALLLLTQTTFAAGEPEEKTEEDPFWLYDSYSAVLYNNTNGLPTSEANAIAQTSEGFIWIGSYSGLIRYDGNTFERMDSTTGIASVVCLYVDSQDRLWIGTNESGVAVMVRGEFQMWNEKGGLESNKICTIEEDGNGIIYVGTVSGISMIYPDMSIHPVDDPRISDVYIEAMNQGSDGLLYCLTNDDIYFTLRDGEVVDYMDNLGEVIADISCVFPDPEAPGMVYIGTESALVYHGDIKGELEEMDVVDISPLSNVIGFRWAGGQIWVGTISGVGTLDEEGFHQLEDTPMNSSIRQVMADYEGNLWFVSTRQGVMKVVKNRFTDLFERYGLSKNVVNSTCMGDDGMLYVGTDAGLLVLNEEGPVSQIPLTSARTASGAVMESKDLVKLLTDCRIRSIIRDSQGRLWISTWKALGLLRYDHGELVVFTESDGLLSSRVRVVRETEDGTILVACTGGLCVIRDDQVIASYGKEEGIENLESLTVEVADNGDYLVGSDGGGISVINEEGIRCINIEDGLTSGVVMRIKRDPSRNIYWIITSNSIAYMTEDYQVITIQKFPYSNNFDLYENSKGDVWILSSNGIYVLPSEELIANGEINSVHYGLSNGMPCIATANSYSELTEDGDLYIAGNESVTKINIEKSLEEIDDLKQAVPYVEIDGERIYPDETGGFTLPSDVQKLTIYGFIYNYSLTDPRVSYWLEGFDREATTVIRSEFDPVSYTNLPGGSYQFVMELKDALGRGGRQLTVPIVKEKNMFERTWFNLLMGLALLLLVFILARLYVRRKMRILEEKHREEAKMERISNELQMATRIQAALLPHDFPPFPDRGEFDIYASMEPAREVGGDFYDFFLIDDNHLCLVMADVSGKGIPAALFMMISKTILKSFATLGRSTADILSRANEMLCNSNREVLFVTVWLGILEISSGRLVAANAGHEYPVLRRAEGRYELFKDQHGLVLGGMSGAVYQEYEMSLSPGDKLFLYTDGVPEAMNAENQMFGIDRMIEALNENPDASPKELLKNVHKSVDAFVKDAEQFDDLTMLCLEYRGNAEGKQADEND